MKKIFLLASFVLNLNAIAQVPSYVPTSGLKAWWSFSGNANDGSGNSLNGVVTNAILSTDRFGNVNQCYDFNYSGARIEVPWNSLLFPDTITVSGWFNIPTGSSGGIFYRSGNGSTDSWKGFILQNDISTIDSLPLYYKDMGGGGYRVYNFLETLYAHKDVWNFFTVVRTPSSLQLYLNGQAAGTLTGLLPYDKPTSTPFIIGNNHLPNDSHVQGKMDDIGIWNRALTQTEITTLYNGCTTASITSGSTTICGSGSILLTANANTTYQWKKNNVVIAGATNQTYSANATGSYTVSVLNSCNTTSTSNAIQINKYALPTSTITANGATSFCTGGSVTLSSTTNAGANALYQWYKGTTAISGATNSSYIATTASTYKCKVTNSLTSCNRTSAGIIVTLHDPTSSITASGPLTFCAGGNVLFTAVTNAGAGALYQWYKNSTGLSGATNSTYTATIAGNYVVVVTNSYGCTKASGIKKVIINCRLEEGISESFYVSPNPCSTCFVNGDMNEQDLIVTDIVGRKINVQFTKAENGFYINLSENDKGIFLIRNIKTSEVVKFVKQ